MDVKSEIIAEIDSRLSFYIDRKDNPDFVDNNSSYGYEMLGAIHALSGLKEQVESLIITSPASFLNDVLFKVESTRKDRTIDSSAGSGANPDAMPGRIEACRHIERFVRNLDARLKRD